MSVKYAYKFRLYPTKDQQVLLAKHFGCSRYLYNYFLARRKQEYLSTGRSTNYVRDCKELTELKKTLPWLTEVGSQSLQQAIKNLDAALSDMDKVAEMAKQMQSLSQQLEKLGKNLAEQLEKGQADLAQSTLEKMKKQLESGKVSPEQMQKLLDEVSKAIDPAKNYGECSKCLSKAGDQMKAGDKAGAAQSLADAAKELEKLMEQFGDAQSLAAAMDALKDASMCVGSGQCWGLCRGKKPGFKPGGKGGVGVGTWADEDQGGSLSDIPMSDELVDNSLVNRPDQDPRGQSERDAEPVLI